MNKKILIFAPHEDDEVLQTAGIIRQAVTQGGTVSVSYTHLTLPTN